MNTHLIIGSCLLALLSGSAYAIAAIPVPEPGILELLGVGAVAMVIATIRQRKKK